MVKKCHILPGSDVMVMHSRRFDGWQLCESSPSQKPHSPALILPLFLLLIRCRLSVHPWAAITQLEGFCDMHSFVWGNSSLVVSGFFKPHGSSISQTPLDCLKYGFLCNFVFTSKLTGRFSSCFVHRIFSLVARHHLSFGWQFVIICVFSLGKEIVFFCLTIRWFSGERGASLICSF